MRNALCTAAQVTDSYQKLSVHMTDTNELVVARNILLSHIMFTVDASNPIDMSYLWDVWHSLNWSESTRIRFVKDLEHLLTFQWATVANILIEAGYAVKLLKRVFKAWLENISNMTVESIAKISKQRLVQNM